MRWSLAVVVACVVALAGCSANKGSSGSGTGGSGASGGSGGSAGVDGGLGGAGGSSGGAAGSAGAPNVPGPVCFLTNCTSDAECHDCSFGRHTCDTVSNRCVACNSGTGQGCPSGKTCTKYGTCAGAGATCPTDAQGNPTVTCSADADCAACDPAHEVCDTASKKCVQCSTGNASACKGNEYCATDGSCKIKCPSTCSADADCAQCGTSAAPAHACADKTHTCGQCSMTTKCPAGEACTPQGVCQKTCGLADQPAGTCDTDADCQYCGAQATACIKPVNGGYGRCGVPATGCSDLGTNVTALPDPWSSITNTCSNDSDCSGVGLNLNIGKLLRDASGLSSSIIHDATFQYPMNACASISVGLGGKNYSCGLCVPCKTDSDCTAIQVDPLAKQMFSGLGSIAAKWALDKLYGDKPHVLNMYCQSVAGNYGVCAPCSDPTSVCGDPNTVGTGCTNVWECAAGETCLNGKCQPAATDCYGGTKTCSGGTICTWNGGPYHCCRTPGTGTKSCATDADCTSPQICSQDASLKWYCMGKATTCN